MFVKTFLVGLMLAAKVGRAYHNRNEDGIKEHADTPTWLKVLNWVEAANEVISALVGNPFVQMGARVKRNSEQYLTAKSNLSKEPATNYIRIPAMVLTREEYDAWRKTL